MMSNQVDHCAQITRPDPLRLVTFRASNPVFLILDGHPVHKSTRVKNYVISTDGRLRLFILPPYSPHLNPDEWLWNWLKRHKVGEAGVSGPDQSRTLVDRYVRSLQELPALILRFFGDLNLAYINQA